MPELVNLTVPATSVAKGDEIASGPAGFVPVVNVDRKVKYVFLTLEGQERQIRWPIDGEVVVRRTQPTQAELDAQRLDWTLRRLDRAEQGVNEDLAAVQEKVGKLMAQGQSLDYWKLAELLEAQARAAVWHRVTHVAQVQANRAVEFDAETGTWSVRDNDEVAAENDGTPALTRLEGLDFVRGKVRDELLEWTSFTSRSTLLASNLVEDYEREAKAKFVSRSGYWMF